MAISSIVRLACLITDVSSVARFNRKHARDTAYGYPAYSTLDKQGRYLDAASTAYGILRLLYRSATTGGRIMLYILRYDQGPGLPFCTEVQGPGSLGFPHPTSSSGCHNDSPYDFPYYYRYSPYLDLFLYRNKQADIPST